MQSTATASSTPSPTAFEKIRSQNLDTLNITIEEYRHRVTGATHYHLASDNPENVFLVALRTVPMDSRGVAHILEHTALCGSKKFPIRDPFFMMIRRSMNTFMNAFTSSDWTAYPFASQNKKDFNNLLEVYLDAVFFASLNEMDFAQEGHRVEFSEPSDASSTLEYKGVVFNEMKGAMSSPNSIIWQQLCKHLFPTSTYHYNSGGDPKHIPNLTYQQLLDFYKTHYHPSNATFMTFGNIPAAEHQEKFEAFALKEFKKLEVHIKVDDEQRYQKPVYAEEIYPLDEDDIENKTHVIIAWLLGNSTKLEDLYKSQLLSSVLLDNSASPLLHALETSDLGRSPSPLCGLEDSQREMSFICGLEACGENSTQAIEQLVISALQKIVDEGIEQSKVEAALHALELNQREISGDSYPYGLQLILASLSTATHRGDPIKLLDIDPVLNQLKDDIKDPSFIPNLIKENLLDNPHRVTLTVRPDATLSHQQNEDEKAKLAEIKSQLNDTQIKAIIEQAQLLEERQNQIDNASILPKVELSDVPVEITWPDSSKSSIGVTDQQYPASFFAQGTNGLSYQQIIIDLPEIPEPLSDVLPYYTNCLSELGVGEGSYLDIQAQQASISGGVSAYTSMRSIVDNEQDIKAYMMLSSKSLYPKQAELSQLMFDTLHHCRFDEYQRVKEIIEQTLSHKEQSITSQGHSLAMGIAASKMSPLAALNYQFSGLSGIHQLKKLCHRFEDPATLQSFVDKFNEVHELMMQSHKQFLLVGEASEKEALLSNLNDIWSGSSNQTTASHFSLPKVRATVREAWLTSTQVNFCAAAFPTVSIAHEDAAALTVLGGFLRNGYLHRVIREQGGAYGGGAIHDSGSASFRFFSYRDPRLAETLEDFEKSIAWLIDRKHEYAQLEEAILGVISSLDKPASPAGTAKHAFSNELFGRNKEQRAQFRERVLATDIEKLKQVAETYLSADKVSIGVVSSKACQDELEKLNLNIRTL